MAKSKNRIVAVKYFTERDPMLDEVVKIIQKRDPDFDELAENSHISRTTLYNWYNNKTRNPTRTRLESVANQLGFTMKLIPLK